MNFLAHTFLSCKDTDLLAGNFMADFIKNKDMAALRPAILQGIELHKNIDSFTDSHDAVRASVKILHPTQGKYAPVIVDILYDYLLSQNWSTYATQSLTTFTQQTYIDLASKMDDYPERLQQKVPLMIADDFLMSCATEERLIQTFRRVARRTHFDHHFDTAHEDLRTHYKVFQAHFDVFFPDLVFHVNEYCGCN